ncbi:MAG: DUF763 domain-containing protein [Thermoleophilia bacterium]|nr:DUF763 domain-containing protein [Thermoleophilia bacterium]
MKTGTAQLPLHGGRAPTWLFARMKHLAREITLAIVSEYGPEEMLRRLSDPVWFQAFGAVLGFDWHSSGLTTTVCGALKEGLHGLENHCGLVVAGGKGATSRKTPSEIERAAELGWLTVRPDTLIYASKMAAKVDSAAVQDGYQLYHHSFVFTSGGKWAVIQQGMNEQSRMARRYHWLSDSVADFVVEPHAAIAAQAPAASVLNMVARESTPAQTAVTQLSHLPPDRSVQHLKKLKELSLPTRHAVLLSDIQPENLTKILLATYERQAENFETLLGLPGVGPKTIRALALIAELVYDTPASRTDPALFSYAHGGKDGHPYPVNRAVYDQNVEFLRRALSQAKVGQTEKLQALRRLAAYTSSPKSLAGYNAQETVAPRHRVTQRRDP